MRLWVALAVPLGLAIAVAADGPRRYRPKPLSPDARAGADALATRIDATLESTWKARKLTPSATVDDLAFARRLWLDLLGTVPSLEELRAIEALPIAQVEGGRRRQLIDRVLMDPRFSATLAEQLTRIVVGPNTKKDDLLYRRRRLVDWLTQQVALRRPWDALVRDLLTAEGLSTDTPAVNFVISQDRDPVKLAARSARAFLGIRLDCAQCHDHPFADWKQTDFEGLAAFFPRLAKDSPGVRDVAQGELELDATGMAMMSMQDAAGPPPGKRWVAPAVPFDPALLPGLDGDEGRRRALAGWITAPKNRYFARAIANRLWAWLLGKGIVDPPDELDVGDPWSEELLDLLADDVVAGGFDLERLIRAIVSTRAYARSSALPPGAGDEEAQVATHATYPLKPLRPDTLGRALFQATSLWTYDERRALLLRFARYFAVAEFADRRGGDDDEDLEEETLVQRLQLLNGKLVTERTKDDDIFSPVRRVPLLTSTDQAAVDTTFLMAFARRPTEDEARPWLERLARPLAAGEKENEVDGAVMADLVWALLNTTEFATNH